MIVMAAASDVLDAGSGSEFSTKTPSIRGVSDGEMASVDAIART